MTKRTLSLAGATKIVLLRVSNRVSAFLFLFVLWPLLIVQATFGAPFQPVRITAGTEESKLTPKIWGDSVVWADLRSDGGGMYRYQFSTGIESRFMPLKPGIDFREGVLSYDDGRPKTYNIETGEAYDLSSRSDRFVYTSLGSDWAAWSASSQSYEYDVYARRIQPDGSPIGSVVQIMSESGLEHQAATDGEYVAWTDSSGPDSGVWLRHMLTGSSQLLGAGHYPAIHGDYVVWIDNGVWVYDISTGNRAQISTVGTVGTAPSLWGHQVVWTNYAELHGHNLLSGSSFIFDAPTRDGCTIWLASTPSIYGDTVVWAQYQEPGGGGGCVDDLYAMQVPEPFTVVNRYIFYNNSVFDAGPEASDDNAIATDKRPLLPGEVATFENCTSFSEGINGIIIDLQNASNTTDITLDDFEFHVGNDEAPESWDSAPTPTITVRPGEGVGSSDRIMLVWPDGSIKNQWLEVTVKATERTGISEEDIFYFGNATGATGDSGTNMLVNAADVVGIRDNPRAELKPAGITDPHDLNRDGLVDAADLVIARDAATSPLAALRLIDLSAAPAAPAPVPEPSSITLSVLGIAGLLTFTRRRQGRTGADGGSQKKARCPAGWRGYPQECRIRTRTVGDGPRLRMLRICPPLPPAREDWRERNVSRGVGHRFGVVAA